MCLATHMYCTLNSTEKTDSNNNNHIEHKKKWKSKWMRKQLRIFLSDSLELQTESTDWVCMCVCAWAREGLFDWSKNKHGLLNEMPNMLLLLEENFLNEITQCVRLCEFYLFFIFLIILRRMQSLFTQSINSK